MNETNKTAARLCFFAGLLFSTLPPALAVLFYFPLWRQAGIREMLSGISALLIVFAALPVLRALRSHFSSPSVTLFWGILFLLFLFLTRIANEMCVISFFGFAGNAAGAVFFRLAKRRSPDARD